MYLLDGPIIEFCYPATEVRKTLQQVKPISAIRDTEVYGRPMSSFPIFSS